MDSGYVAWMLISASLVLLMTTPGLALFYGGMTRAKSVLNMMMMSYGALAVVGVVYVLWGYSMSYGGSSIAGIFANPFDMFGLAGIGEDAESGSYITVAFQLTFAVITAALISGAIADRVKFSTWMVFVPIWATMSYFPLAHMVWGGGLLSDAGDGIAAWLFGSHAGEALVAPIDYAGGTVVHINAGVAALVLTLVVGRRLGFMSTPMRPHNLTLTMIGAGLLWFGWFGFNVGSIIPTANPADFSLAGQAAFAANFVSETSMVWVNTTVAACAAVLGWLAIERVRDGRVTSLGAASGIVAGLVAITPACGNVTPVGAIVLGALAGIACAGAVGLKHRFGFDDALDVVGVHLVGGLVGTLAVGFLAVDSGLLYGHGFEQLIVQVAITAVAMVWSAVMTLGVALALRRIMGWRVEAGHERRGLDPATHGERAYDWDLDFDPDAELAEELAGDSLP